MNIFKGLLALVLCCGLVWGLGFVGCSDDNWTCSTEICNDAFDNDCDGYIDCEDEDCIVDEDNDEFPARITLECLVYDCDDNDDTFYPGADDECDPDEIDTDCGGFDGVCEGDAYENCNDGIDNDCDELVDMDDNEEGEEDSDRCQGGT